MKNKNQKEIDMIAQELECIFGGPNGPLMDWGKIATSILTKLHKDEIVIAGGKVKQFQELYGLSVDDNLIVSEKLEKFKDKTIIIKAVVKDE